MNLHELQSAVRRLARDELAAFARWFDEFTSEEWDRRIEDDIKAGKLDEAAGRADAEFDAGQCSPL